MSNIYSFPRGPYNPPKGPRKAPLPYAQTYDELVEDWLDDPDPQACDHPHLYAIWRQQLVTASPPKASGWTTFWVWFAIGVTVSFLIF